MQITVNAQTREVDDGASVAQLLEALGVNPKHVAVEVNLDLAPRTTHQQHVLQPGDRLEIVTLVGGG